MRIVFEKQPVAAFLLGEQSVDKSLFYRKASFCVVTRVDDREVAYNSLTHELVELTFDEAKMLSGEAAPYTAGGEALIRSYFLVPADNDDEKLCDGIYNLVRAAAKSSGHRFFTVFPTMDCNARCFYCYEHGCTYASMSADTAEKTADFIINSSNGAPVEITWYGGEPLMNTEAIDTISSRLCALGTKYSSRIATNGSLFDEALVKKAKELWHVGKAQITLDGTPEIYERIKAYSDGKSDFETVILNVARLLDSNIKVNIRLNADFHNIDDLQKLCELLASRFGGRDGFNVYTAMLFDCEGAKRPIGGDMNRLTLAKALIELEDKCEALNILHPRKLNLSPLPTFCKAVSEESIAVTAEGKLVKCDFFTDEHFVGDVYYGFDKTKLKEEKEKFLKHIACKGCTAYPVCRRPEGCPTGGCDNARKYMTEERLVRSVRYAYMKGTQK